MNSPSIITEKSIPAKFDDFDVWLLAYYYPEVDLNREIKKAREMIPAAKAFNDTPCGYLWGNIFPIGYDTLESVYRMLTFDYQGWIKICQEALQCRLTSVKRSANVTTHKHIDVESIKAKNDIVTVIEQYTQLRKSGNNRFTGKCPLHDDRGPSLTVYADSQSWHCFGACNKGGDVITFTMLYHACDFKQAAAMLGGL